MGPCPPASFGGTPLAELRSSPLQTTSTPPNHGPFPPSSGRVPLMPLSPLPRSRASATRCVLHHGIMVWQRRPFPPPRSAVERGKSPRASSLPPRAQGVGAQVFGVRRRCRSTGCRLTTGCTVKVRKKRGHPQGQEMGYYIFIQKRERLPGTPQQRSRHHPEWEGRRHTGGHVRHARHNRA